MNQEKVFIWIAAKDRSSVVVFFRRHITKAAKTRCGNRSNNKQQTATTTTKMNTKIRLICRQLCNRIEISELLTIRSSPFMKEKRNYFRRSFKCSMAKVKAWSSKVVYIYDAERCTDTRTISRHMHMCGCVCVCVCLPVTDVIEHEFGHANVCHRTIYAKPNNWPFHFGHTGNFWQMHVIIIFKVMVHNAHVTHGMPFI